jgi:hypothetical protein
LAVEVGQRLLGLGAEDPVDPKRAQAMGAAIFVQ